MRRLLLGTAVVAGLFMAGVTNASASTYCTLDPTLPAGVPVKSSVNVYLIGSHVYVYGNSMSTTFGGGIALP